MKNKIMIPLVILITMLNCSSKQDTGSLLAPISWAYLGIEKKELIKRLPLQGSKITDSNLFLGVWDIKEETYKKTGLKSLFFYFRLQNGKKILNATQMVFKKEPKKIIQTKKQLEKLYTKIKNNRYRKGKTIKVDLNESYPKIFKVTFDTKG